MSTVPLRIDFVSDLACPWCAVGLASLQQALAELDGQIEATIHFQPFELNPQMPPEGENSTEHIAHKYGITPAQIQDNRKALHERGAEVGFAFTTDDDSRIHNTFDAHRLLHWAGTQGPAQQLALKQRLLQAQFSEGANVGAHDTLVKLAGEAGLDETQARQILASDTYAAQVREQEKLFQGRGIHSVPATIVNGQHLISGGQPPEAFVQALRQIAADAPVDG